MENKNVVNWFEIPVKDMDRARGFYEDVFGVKLEMSTMGPTEMGMFPYREGVIGAAGSLVKSKGYKPSKDGSRVYFSVADIEAALAKITAKGGKTLSPKTGIGEWGFIAYFQDTEGNQVALHSMN